MPAIAGDLRDPVKQDPPPDGDSRRERTPHRGHPESQDRPSPENGVRPGVSPRTDRRVSAQHRIEPGVGRMALGLREIVSRIGSP